MHARTASLFVLLTGILTAGSVALSAQSPQALERFAGTWRLNVAKSKFSPGPGAKSNTATIKVSEGGLLVVSDGVNGQGQQNHTEILSKFDGRDHALKGAAQPTTRAFKWIDDYTHEWVQKVNGKQTTTTRVSLSRDGKTQTLTTTGTNAQGQKVNNVTVFEKQ